MQRLRTIFDDLEVLDWKKYWKGMPEYVLDDLSPAKSILIHFRDQGDLDEFSKLIEQPITDRTKFIYYPKLEKANLLAKICHGKGNPTYPIFIPTKGRYKLRLTIKAFEKIGVPFKIVIERQEYREYAQFVDKKKILVLPFSNKGLIATRNWIWDYAQNELKTPFFWTFDDNIRDFYRLNRNIKYRMDSGIFMKIIEEFVERYENIAIAGMQYELFVPRKRISPPFILNTRIYSNMLIRTDIPYRNELFFNDDTDLCLRVMKDGWCTFLFQAFLADKQATMLQRGGMTDYYEKTDKRLEFARALQEAHPDCVKITWKFHRWHHQVDYSMFKKNKLKLRRGVQIEEGINEYGMVLKNE